jgi:hypothetical protein
MTRANRPPSAVFHAVTHVWGREYLDLFLNVCIPNQLAPGNVPALSKGSRYRILTRSNHVGELEQHPMVHALRGVIAVDLVVVDELDRQDGANGYELMNACHQRAVADAIASEAALVFLSADVILSDNTLSAVVRRHSEGYRAVVCTGLRLSKESFLEDLTQSNPALAPWSPRELVRFAWPHLHPHTRSMFVDAPRFSKAPSAVYWPVGTDGLLARCLHLHPLMVDPIEPVPLTEGTCDGPYLAQACPDFSRVHVVTDSDELQIFELTTAGRQIVGTIDASGATWPVAIVAAQCDALQLLYWQTRPIRIHARDLDERWIAPADAAERFALSVMSGRRYARMSRRWFRLAGDIRKRRTRYAKAWHRQRRRIRLDRIEAWAVRRMEIWERRRPRIRLKQIQRPVRLLLHQAAKAWRLWMKRVHRRARPGVTMRVPPAR